jgi:hypothetical protein
VIVMSAIVADVRLDVPRKMIAAGLRQDNHGERKRLAEDWKPLIGQAIERALVLANLSKQEASYAMGYSDQSALSRWLAGTERPQLDKLFAIDGLRQWIPVALAEVAGAEIQTTVIVRRIA